MGAVPRQRQPPRHHPHPTAVAARPSCVLPAKAGIQTSGAPPPPTPAASQTSLPHRRGDSRTARPATAPTPPPSPAPDRRRSPPLMRHTGESQYPDERGTPTTNPFRFPDSPTAPQARSANRPSRESGALPALTRTRPPSQPAPHASYRRKPVSRRAGHPHHQPPSYPQLPYRTAGALHDSARPEPVEGRVAATGSSCLPDEYDHRLVPPADDGAV